MSRVSEALRRAGYQQDERGLSPSSSDEAPFAPTEDVADGGASVLLEEQSGEAQENLAARSAPVVVQGPASGAFSDDVRLQDILRVIYRRRWMIAVIVLASLGIAIAYNMWSPRIFEARARVLVQPSSEEVVPFRSSSGEDLGRSDYFLTQLDILRSQGLARRTLQDAHLLSADSARQVGQVNQFLGSLIVSTSKTELGESRVINIAYRSKDPVAAAKMVNGLAKAYIDENLESRRQASVEAAKWLNQRVDELRQQVSSSEGALQNYRRQQNSASLDDRQNIVVQKFAQLNTAVTAARTERVEKESLYNQLVALQQRGDPIDTFPPILGNTFIQGIKAELAGLQAEKLQLSERLGDLHPDMIKVNTAIQNAQTRLNAEISKVVDGIKNDYANAVAKERGLTAALDTQNREVLTLNEKAIGYNDLQRDATSTQQTFTTVLQRAKETELAAELQSNNIKILDSAQVPRTPVLPRTQLNLAIALFGGCFFALVAVFGTERLNPRIVNPEDVSGSLGLPLLGVAPRVTDLKDAGTLMDLPYSLQEAIRDVRTQLFIAPQASGAARIFAITSAKPGEGKTMLAGNLAMAMAMAGRRILLVDADLRRPRLHEMFNVPKSPGLSNVIAGENRPSEVLVESATKGLFILPAGADVPSPADLLDSERLEQLLQGFRQVFDVVILDCPPVMAVTDASIVANAATSVVFVVSAGSTSPEVARAALDRLTSVKARIIGAVLNRADLSPRSEYHYGYKTANADA